MVFDGVDEVEGCLTFSRAYSDWVGLPLLLSLAFCGWLTPDLSCAVGWGGDGFS